MCGIGAVRRELRYNKRLIQVELMPPSSWNQQTKKQLEVLIAEARACGVYEPTRMTLCTAESGVPTSRTVLLKQVADAGLVFYTNYRSRKGQQLLAYPWVSLQFCWLPKLPRVSVQGHARPVSGAEADAYWRTRPRLSQIGAWASKQSQPLIAGRGWFWIRLIFYTGYFAWRTVPRPPHWSGFLIEPTEITFHV
jgi:pyridoxamine 5'-phosphate oxidase